MIYLFPLWKVSFISLSIMERNVMTNDINKEANEALKQAKKSEAAALKVAMPAKWFGIVIALIAGGIVAANGSDYYQYSGYFIFGLALVVALHHKKTGATPLPMPTNKMGLYALIFIILFFLVITATVRYTTSQLGMNWTPFLGGGFVAIFVYLLAASERKKYMQKIKDAGLDTESDA